MDRKLLAVALAALLVGGVIGKGLGAESAKEAANKAKQAAFNDGRAAGCTTLVRLVSSYGDAIKGAVEADGALYVEGAMVRDGKHNLDQDSAQQQQQ